VVDVLAIPGHDVAHLAYYDRKTGVLLTGDPLYPGRLYVMDFPAYVESTRRLVRFTEGKTVTHILVCHIENPQPHTWIFRLERNTRLTDRVWNSDVHTHWNCWLVWK